jgi:hypothetical protein
MVNPILDQPVETGLHIRNVIYTVNWLIFAGIVLFMWLRVVRDKLDESDLAEIDAE